jgi:AcrR family transcriptional regulator
MGQSISDNPNNTRESEISLAAQKRFGTYGFEKTTMQEIAQDLGISKASLYYYYPDKESLYKAVVEKETEYFLAQLCHKLENCNNPSDSLKIYTEIRLDYFRTLMNLSRIRFEENPSIKNIMHELRLRFREKEKEKISGILIDGKSKGVFDFNNEDAYATLFLDTLRGLTLVYKKNKDITYLSEEDFTQLKDQIMLFVLTFIKGISKN